MELSHLQAKSIVERAWRVVHSRSPSTRELLFVLAIASLETGYGRTGQFQALAQRGLFNWGAEQRQPEGDVCPAGTAPGGDTYEGKPVSVCFYVSRTDDEAAVRLIRTLTVNFPSRAQAILSAMKNGSAADVAHAMKVNPPYYTASEESYAKGLGAKVDTIAKATGLVLSSVSMLLPVGATVIASGIGMGLGVLAWRKWGR